MTIACYAVHFGREYLGWSIRSIQHAVDEIHIFHAPEPSYGFSTGATPIDTREDLEREAFRFLAPGKSVIWHTVRGTNHEGQHRNLMTEHARRIGSDQFIILDADEIWTTESAKTALKAVADANCGGRWLTNFCNFWRSFNWRVYDGFQPIRIVDLRHPLHVDKTLDASMQPDPVYHFGYAQSEKTMRYKVTCHSHTDEMVKRGGWTKYLDEKFFPWRPGDPNTNRYLHPTSDIVWADGAHPTESDVLAKLRGIVGDHPYWGLDLIV